MQNCGIKALEGITKLENVSMYTLIHLAKDNGIDFYFCRVAKEDLPLVSRPAIFHSDDHFTLVEDGKALPKEDFSGWVLTPKPMGQPLPYSLAKQITGGKKSGGFIGTILPFVGAVVGNLIAPGIGGIIGGALGGGGGAALAGAKGGQIALGALGGAFTGGLGGSSAPLLAGLTAGGSALAGGAGIGQAALSGLGGYLGAKGVGNFNAGVNAAPAGSSLFGKLGSGFGNILGGGAGGAAPGGSGTPQGGTGGTYGLTNGGTSAGLAGGAFGSPLAPYTPPTAASLAGGFGGGGYNALTQYSSGLAARTGGSQVSVPTLQNYGASTGGGSGLLGGSNTTTGTGGGSKGLFGGLDTNTLLKGGLLLASGAQKPPDMNYDPLANYNAAQKYIGENSSLPKPTMDQLNQYVTSSIADLKKQFYNPDAGNAALLNIDKQYQQALADVQRQAAQGGQSIATSSDAQKQYNEIQRQWTEARSNLQAQLDQQATTQAIGVKQWALEQSIKAGQFDVGSAMELAAQVGMQQQLQYAIDSKNYDAFQQIVAQLLDPGLSQTITQTGPNGTTTTTVKQSGGLLSNVLGK